MKHSWCISPESTYHFQKNTQSTDRTILDITCCTTKRTIFEQRLWAKSYDRSGTKAIPRLSETGAEIHTAPHIEHANLVAVRFVVQHKSYTGIMDGQLSVTARPVVTYLQAEANWRMNINFDVGTAEVIA